MINPIGRDNRCRHRSVYISIAPPTAAPKTRQFAFGALVRRINFKRDVLCAYHEGEGKGWLRVKRLYEYRVEIRGITAECNANGRIFSPVQNVKVTRHGQYVGQKRNERHSRPAGGQALASF